MNKNFERKKLISVSIIIAVSIQMVLITISFNSKGMASETISKIQKIYSVWHVDTDLQIMSKIIGIEGNKEIGLSLVTATSKSYNINDVNRFNPEINGLNSSPYLSSSGIIEILSNWIFFKVINERISPNFFLLILRVVLLLISYFGFYCLLMILSLSIKGRIFPIFMIIFLFGPWLFLDATSLFWSPAIRFAPLIYLAYLFIRNMNMTKVSRIQSLNLILLIVISTFNGFEYSFLVTGIILIWYYKISDGKSIKRLLNCLMLGFFSVLGSLLSWYFVLIHQLQNNSISAISVIRYTIFKHSSLKFAGNLSVGALQSADPQINAFSALFRMLARTSLLLPYDIMLVIRGENRFSQILIFIFVFLTSFTSVLILMLLLRGIPAVILLNTISLLVIWIVSIKSYAFHHVHILGSALLIYLCVLYILPIIEKDKIANHNF
jgi:hypothetical protein